MANVYTEPYAIDSLPLSNCNNHNHNKLRSSTSSNSSLHGNDCRRLSSSSATSDNNTQQLGYNMLFVGSEYETFANLPSSKTATATSSSSSSATNYNKLAQRGRLESNQSDDVFVEFEALEVSSRNSYDHLQRQAYDRLQRSSEGGSSASLLSSSSSSASAAGSAVSLLSASSSASASASSAAARKSSLPPVLTLAGWYHGNISREEAEHRLKNWGSCNGLFLVREKAADEEYAISFCENGRYEHRLLRRAVRANGERGNHWILNEMRLQDCTSIESVVALCMSTSDPLKNLPRLTQPCLKTRA